MTSAGRPPAACPARAGAAQPRAGAAQPRAGAAQPLVDAAFPHEAYPSVVRRLAAAGPVHPVVLPGGLNAWLVTDRGAVCSLAVDPRLSLDLRRIPEPSGGVGHRRYPEDGGAGRGRHLLNTEGPDHHRLRHLTAPFLSSTALEQRRPMIEAAAEHALKALARCDPGDLVAQYAHPVASEVMSNLLGIPGHLRHPFTAATIGIGAPDHPDSEPMRAAERTHSELIRQMMEVRRNDPGDDLITLLFDARAQEGRPTLLEIHAMIGLLFLAGTETTSVLIAYGAARLIQHPPALHALLRDDEHAKPVVEELLRHHPPLPTGAWRFTTEPVTVGDTTIPEGACVLLSFAAPGQDADVYPHPDQLVPGRSNAPAHLSFGHGPHYCVGAHLARLEGLIALRALFHRYPSMELAAPLDSLTWSGSTVNRRLDTLPVTFGTGSTAGSSTAGTGRRETSV
ncbi:cytochrome P450 [Streptomyces yaizuensis]|uniref:Cytochrome P450 n=1 Tax=Streptomyces yaizuensis TaxID=2989713 RepID=A0ABQ5NXM6_9ACTN|nr:cytochrome P450 [Streptomyces sp. YSPA8]GLF95125.1 cytochrome P450 [Streptomyces sp. YSPA8]